MNVLTLKEVAKMLGVGTQTVVEWSNKGRIEFVSVDGEYYFTKDAIDSFIAETGIQLVEPMIFNSESKDLLTKHFEFGEIGKMLSEHYEEHNILTPEEIENLFKKEQKK